MGTALKGQKPWTEASPPINSFALSGRWLLSICTQGAALGYVQIALSGRANVSLLSTVQVEFFLVFSSEDVFHCGAMCGDVVAGA